MGQFYKYTEKRAPTMLRLLLIVLVILPGVTFSNDQLTGEWESENEDLRLDVLDGFKPNRGAILAIENGVGKRRSDSGRLKNLILICELVGGRGR